MTDQSGTRGGTSVHRPQLLSGSASARPLPWAGGCVPAELTPEDGSEHRGQRERGLVPGPPGSGLLPAWITIVLFCTKSALLDTPYWGLVLALNLRQRPRRQLQLSVWAAASWLPPCPCLPWHRLFREGHLSGCVGPLRPHLRVVVSAKALLPGKPLPGTGLRASTTPGGTQGAPGSCRREACLERKGPGGSVTCSGRARCL